MPPWRLVDEDEEGGGKVLHRHRHQRPLHYRRRGAKGVVEVVEVVEVCSSYNGGDIFGILHNIHRSNTQGSGGRSIQNKYGDGIRVLPTLVLYVGIIKIFIY